nr:ATP synthase subunit 6 [Microphthalmus similis]
MMLDIFSSFDPYIHNSAQLSPSSFWVMMFVPLLVVSSSMWCSPTILYLSSYTPTNIINDQSSRTFGDKIKGFPSLMIPLFSFIIMINLMGLLPYVFSYSAHLIMTLSMGLPLWLALLMSGITHNTSSFMASLLPGGAPDWLNPALVMIETVSILVRPLTLSFRLGANMSAGHIVLGLIGIYASSALFMSIYSLLALLFVQIIYVLFEVGICLIQAYIFCLLLTLYADDHPH